MSLLTGNAVAIGQSVQPSPSRSFEENRDEVWNGVLVMSPLANDEHQELVGLLVAVFLAVVHTGKPWKVRPGVNVSDREKGWEENYRIPDIAVFLPGTKAKNCDTHWCGGPDFGVEIVSDKDQTHEKLPFYAKVNTCEVLLVDRDPWCLSLYRLDEKEMVLVGKSSLDSPADLVSAVLPLTFRLIPGDERPAIEVTSSDKTQRWVV